MDMVKKSYLLIVIMVGNMLVLAGGLVVTDVVGRRAKAQITDYFVASNKPVEVTDINRDFIEIGDDNIKKIEGAYPNYSGTKDILPFLDALEQAGVKTGVDPNVTFEQALSTSNTGQNQLRFRISFKGNSLNTLSFIDSMLELPYFIGIDSYAINHASQVAENDSIVEVRAKIYVRRKQ